MVGSQKLLLLLVKNQECNVAEGDDQRYALIYLLTLSEDTRINFDSCYDKDEGQYGEVKIDCIHKCWVTNSDARLIRLAFNLFNGAVPTACNLQGEEKIDELYRNTPDDLFYGPDIEYYFEAVRILFHRCGVTLDD